MLMEKCIYWLWENCYLLSEQYDMGNNLGKFPPKMLAWLSVGYMIWDDFIDFVLCATYY